MYLPPHATAVFAVPGHPMQRPASLRVLSNCPGLPLLSPPSPSPPRKLPLLQDTSPVLPPLFQAFPDLQVEVAIPHLCPTASMVFHCHCILRGIYLFIHLSLPLHI